METLALFATTARGIEDIACEEVAELARISAKPEVGRISFSGRLEDIYLLNLKARTINKVFIELCREEFEDLEGIYKLAREIDYAWIIDPHQTFAVRSERIGAHDFTSMDVSRVVGQAIKDSFEGTKGRVLRVNLEDPDVEFYSLVRDNQFLLGVNTTGPSLHRRGYRVYNHPAALKPTIAYSMLRIGDWTPSKTILDPMCGGATIPIEAALWARNSPPGKFRYDFAFCKLKICNRNDFEELKTKLLGSEIYSVFPIYAMDKNDRHLKGGIENAQNAGVSGTINFKLGDATNISDYPRLDVDLFAVNPPYGLRAYPKEGVRRLYEKFIGTIKANFEGATLVMISSASKILEETFEKLDVTVMNSRSVWHGDLQAKIVKCTV
ncbi:MAG: tRNA (guanine(6)-N2)-methyltransferase [Nitrososphaerota archaeon]|nr:tRNA (guanine(6)-N2)-methyltransferase [Candidatus Bathyarchaeota archaeon]MDW8048223.1 tRNA (guanine(6)-N2)-methyltransferase [Nitrososphaerota archaeon]